jgi:hypothetical protein
MGSFLFSLLLLLLSCFVSSFVLLEFIQNVRSSRNDRPKWNIIDPNNPPIIDEKEEKDPNNANNVHGSGQDHILDENGLMSHDNTGGFHHTPQGGTEDISEAMLFNGMNNSNNDPQADLDYANFERKDGSGRTTRSTRESPNPQQHFRSTNNNTPNNLMNTAIVMNNDGNYTYDENLDPNNSNMFVGDNGPIDMNNFADDSYNHNESEPLLDNTDGNSSGNMITMMSSGDGGDSADMGGSLATRLGLNLQLNVVNEGNEEEEALAEMEDTVSDLTAPMNTNYSNTPQLNKRRPSNPLIQSSFNRTYTPPPPPSSHQRTFSSFFH